MWTASVGIYAAFTCYWNQWHAQRVRGKTEGGGANI